MKKIIHLDLEDRRKLKEHFGVSQAAITLALTFQRNSLLSRQIRAYALNRFSYTEISNE